MFKYKIKNVLKFYIFTQITSDTYFIFSYTITYLISVDTWKFQDRLCMSCKIVEDESHFMLHCKKDDILRVNPIFNIITFNQSCFSHYNILQDVHLKINEIDMFRTWDIYWWFIFYMENNFFWDSKFLSSKCYFSQFLSPFFFYLTTRIPKNPNIILVKWHGIYIGGLFFTWKISLTITIKYNTINNYNFLKYSHKIRKIVILLHFTSIILGFLGILVAKLKKNGGKNWLKYHLELKNLESQKKFLSYP
jgi:hypothetical protein